MPIAGLALRSGMLLNTAGRYRKCLLFGSAANRSISRERQPAAIMQLTQNALPGSPSSLHQISWSAFPQMVSEMIEVAVTVLRPIPHVPVELSLITTPCGAAGCPPKYAAMPCAWQPLAESK